MDDGATYDKREVDEVEKVKDGEDIIIDRKMTRTVLWKLDTRYVFNRASEEMMHELCQLGETGSSQFSPSCSSARFLTGPTSAMRGCTTSNRI